MTSFSSTAAAAAPAPARPLASHPSDLVTGRAARDEDPPARRLRLTTGVTLPYVDHGPTDGLPVLLLHGVIDSWHAFDLVRPLLPPTLRVLALTQRGHGEADRPADGYAMTDFAADAAAFLQALDLGPAIVVGHSMGATVAQRLALDHPARVAGLVLLGSFARFADNAAVRSFVADVVDRLTDPVDPAVVREFQTSTLACAIPPEFLELMIREGERLPARVWQAAFAGMLEDAHAERLHAISAPARLVWGEHDAFVPRRDQDRLLQALPQARLRVLTGVGHSVHWEAPAAVAAAIVELADTLRTTMRA